MTVAAPRVVAVDRIADVDAAEWDRLVPAGAMYLRHAWLATLEGNEHFVPRYLLARDPAGRLVGALPTYLTDGRGSKLYDPFVHLLERAGRPSEERARWFPALLGGTRASFVNDLLLDPAGSDSSRRQCLTALVGAFDRAVAERGARSAAWMYTTTEATRSLMPLAGDAVVLLAGASTRLRVTWDSLDAYCSSRSRNRAKAIRREIRRFRGSGAVVERGRLADHYADAGPLLANVERRHGHDTTAARMTEVLRMKAAHVGDDAVVLLCRRDERLVAFSVVFPRGDELYVWGYGCDYDACGDDFEYFNLVFYEPIEYAIETGRSTIHLGVESYEAKVARGAEPVPLWSLIAPTAGLGDDWRASLGAWNERARARWEQLAARLHVELDDAQWRAFD